jgi:hypothetical protein
MYPVLNGRPIAFCSFENMNLDMTPTIYCYMNLDMTPTIYCYMKLDMTPTIYC